MIIIHVPMNSLKERFSLSFWLQKHLEAARSKVQLTNRQRTELRQHVHALQVGVAKYTLCMKPFCYSSLVKSILMAATRSSIYSAAAGTCILLGSCLIYVMK